MHGKTGKHVGTQSGQAALPRDGRRSLKSLRLSLCLVLTIAIFATDTIFVISPAISVLYIVPLLLLANSRLARLVRVWACMCVALATVSFVLGLPESIGPMALPNLAIGLIAIVVTAQQLTRAAALRGQLSADERRYRTVFNSLAVAVWEYDLSPVQTAISRMRAEGMVDLRRHIAENPEIAEQLRRLVRITDVNETALKLVGVLDKTTFFDRITDLLQESEDGFAACIVALDERQPQFQAQAMVLTAAGDPLEVIMAYSFDGTGPLDRVAVSVLNVTEQNRLAKLIAENRDQLARAEQSAALGQMAASIAHEIEQPLTAIQTSLGAAERWLRREMIDIAEVAAAIGTANRATLRAKEVIRRIRALIIGSAGTEVAPVEFDTLIQEAAALLQGDIAQRGVRLTQVLRTPVVIHGDRILLQQVVVNVVRNALQALDGMAEEQRALLIATDLLDGEVRLAVTDSGPGWPPEILAEAFAAFRTTKTGGMGLGLSICRTIIEAHNGAIFLENADTGGATVRITLPVNSTGSDAKALRRGLQTQIQQGIVSFT